MAMLTACNGGPPFFPTSPQISGAQAGVAQTPQHRRRGPLVYVSDSLGNFVDVFAKDGALLGRISDGLNFPVDLFVDGKHDLFVANNGSGVVLKFKRDTTTPVSAYTDVPDAWASTTCASGTLYVAHYSGSIAVFAPGHHKPTGSRNENYGLADSISCDPRGNVFATGTVGSPPGVVFEFPGGKKKAKLLPLYLLNPVDVKPDPAGNLLILDSAGSPYDTVTEYTEAGTPTGKSMPTAAYWSEMAITPNGKEIFGADQSDLEGVLKTFPGGRVLHTYADSRFRQLGGIAYDPGER
ncbi:MAG: hypothetical protein JO104_01810 [Candidatus Eremiobacteraeota bacterium]|nr:hypothetical protein [Candidatus Eremiobacteraeota bacterium]